MTGSAISTWGRVFQFMTKQGVSENCINNVSVWAHFRKVLLHFRKVSQTTEQLKPFYLKLTDTDVKEQKFEPNAFFGVHFLFTTDHIQQEWREQEHRLEVVEQCTATICLNQGQIDLLPNPNLNISWWTHGAQNKRQNRLRKGGSRICYWSWPKSQQVSKASFKNVGAYIVSNCSPQNTVFSYRFSQFT